MFAVWDTYYAVFGSWHCQAIGHHISYKHLSRLAQHFDSAPDVVADILRERGRASPEHVNAARLVDILDSEAMLQMGMLADCAELCLELTRFFLC